MEDGEENPGGEENGATVVQDDQAAPGFLLTQL